MRIFRQPVLLIALACAAPSAVHAQTGQIGSYNRPRTNANPPISPYLNLDRTGNPGVNYYGLVRPQIDTNRALQQIDPTLFGGDPRLGLGGAAVGPDGNPIPGALANQAFGLNTGHPATFFYYSHYYQFPTMQRGGGGAGGANSGFGRPSTPSIPFFAGGNGVILPLNPAGANPVGGQFGIINPPTAPGMPVMP